MRISTDELKRAKRVIQIYCYNSASELIIIGLVNIMNKTVKIVIGIVVLVLVVWGISALVAPKAPAGGKPTITIGITLPLTGPVATLGLSNKNAIELAQAQLPTNLKYNYKLVFEDDQFKPALGASNANQLISVDGASALISFGSPVGNAVSPIATQNQITHINDFASDPHVASGTYNFVDYTPAAQDAKVFFPQLIKRNIHTVVFFGQQDNTGALALINTFLADASNTPSIKVVSTQLFNTGTTDFRSQIAQVKGLNPDIYVFEASSPELETLTQQLRQAGVNTPITTMEAFDFSSQLSLFEGDWYVDAASPTQWFTDLYTKTYNTAPLAGAANGYDTLNLIVQAAESVGDGKTVPSSTQIAQAVSKITGFNGALGNNLSVGPDHLVVSDAVVKMIKNGMPVTIGQ
jgi:branched-chain amino acid transport system substrate-binding protein